MVVLWKPNQFNLPAMKRIIFQALLLIALFFCTWFLLQQNDWMKTFKVEETSNKLEQKLGDLFWDIIKKSKKENTNPFLVKSIDSMVSKICKANQIDRSQIKVHVLESDDINAFALPNGHLVINSGLIVATQNQEALCGVIGHEIAHIELSHIMKKLIKEIGLSALITISTSGGDSEIIKEVLKKLTASAYDRTLEKEADLKAVEYLKNADISAEPFANFLYEIALRQGDEPKYLTWINTHPDTKERAAYIIEKSKEYRVINKPVLTPPSWKKLKAILQE